MSTEPIDTNDIVAAYGRLLGAATNMLAVYRRMQMVLRSGSVEAEHLADSIGQIQRLEREAGERGLQRTTTPS